MKINNEVKIGVLVIVAIAAVVFGIKMLQGKSLFESGKDLIAYYDDAAGLQNSSAVLLKGVQIGRVKEISINKDQKIKVVLHINKGYDIPVGSVAQMASTSLISSDKVVSIVFPEPFGDNFLKDGDIIAVKKASDLINDLGESAKPILSNVDSTIQNIDSVVSSVNAILNYQTQMHLKNTFQNLDATLVELSKLSVALNQQTQNLSKIMGNVGTFTDNLSANNQKITNMMTNLEGASKTFNGQELKNSLKSIESASENLNRTLANINSSDGTLGLLTNDRKMYDNLLKLSTSMDELMIDLKKHPGRYINISVLGSNNR